MVLNIAELSLPTHILQALRGDLHAVNTVTADAPQKPVKTLNSEVIAVNLQATIESPYYEIESNELSDFTGFDILE